MKNIIKVENIEILPDIRPLIALDLNGNLRQFSGSKPEPVFPPNDEIWYTSEENVVVDPYVYRPAGSLPKILSNTNENGKGVIKFESDVTSIGADAFYNCIGLTSVTIPASVTSIGEWAFEDCTSLTSITIPNSVTAIGNSAFKNCTKLTSAVISNNVTSIEREVFCGCSDLSSVTIGNSVTSIGNSAFSDCDALTSIEIPNSVTSIGYGCFNGCVNLISVTIPSSVTSIEDRAFGNHSGGGGNPSIFDITFTSTTPVSLVYSNQQIKNILGAVNYYTSLSIHVPEGYESIYAEYDAGWEALAPFIVGYVPKTKTIFTYSDSTTSTSSDKTISQSSYNRNKILTSVEIGTRATSIGSEAFKLCWRLVSATIPNSVISIGNSAFHDCSDLSSVTIGNSVTSIGNSAFEDCGLTSVTIPSSVTSIGDSAFDSCNYLAAVTIPSSVTSIGDHAFYHANIIATFMSTIPNISLKIGSKIILPFGGDVDSEPAEVTIIVPAGCKAAYVAKDEGWEAYANYIQEAQ